MAITISAYLEQLIEKCGGFGKFQLILVIILFASKGSVTWTMLMMMFAGAEPDWWCSEYKGNDTSVSFKSCDVNGTECSNFRFDTSMVTVVSEWDLTCDRKSITSSITTIQMSGVLVGGLAVGQFADYFGRKPAFFISLLISTATNLGAYFSVNWEMFAALRFFMGISCGMLLTVYIVWMYEFLGTSKRAFMAGLPSWALFALIMAFVCWLLPNWKHLHLATAALSGPLLFTWWFMPESFRWLVSHGRFDDARLVIEKVARINGVKVPDLSDLEKVALQNEDTNNRTYTLLDLFKKFQIRKNTLLLAFMWITCGFVYYAIYFNIQKLSGSIYLNMFLLSLVEIPGNSITICLNNKFGRSNSCIAFMLLTGIGTTGIAVTDLTNIDPDLKGQLINGFAITSKLGIAAAWVCLVVLSTEVYPTVVRNLGFGFMNTAARIGAMLAPKLIYLSDLVPGLLYFLSTALVLASCLCAYFATETNNLNLEDTLHSQKKADINGTNDHPKDVEFTTLLEQTNEMKT